MKNLSAKQLQQYANENGIVNAVHSAIGNNVEINLPFGENLCKSRIEELDLSVRSFNCLKRQGINTVDDLIELLHTEGLTQIRNLGKKSRNEIKTSLLNYGYKHLTAEKQFTFLENLIRDNE